MNTFTIYPAIDLLGGRVVRLEQGKRNKKMEFGFSPESAASHWISQGAEWLHVVSLNGAFGEAFQSNFSALKKIISTSKGTVSIQFGGGLRDIASIEYILSLGVARIILGTSAVKNPELIRQSLYTFGPEKVILGVDAKDGMVRVSGWEEITAISPQELVQQFIPDQLETVIYTNISNDGMKNGVDINSTKELAEESKLNVIASGGVSELNDIERVKAAGLSGVIVGRALYENNFTLTEALQC